MQPRLAAAALAVPLIGLTLLTAGTAASAAARPDATPTAAATSAPAATTPACATAVPVKGMPTVTYTPAKMGSAATVSALSVAGGIGFVIANGDTGNPVTLTSTTKGWTLDCALAAGKATTAQVLATKGAYTVKAVGTDYAGLLGIGAESGTASGTVTVTSTAASATPPTKTTAPPAAGTTTKGATAPTPSAASSSPTATSSAAAGPSVAYPGGVVGSIAPGTTVSGSVLPPQVAPYATSTAPDGSVTTLFSTVAPTPDTSAVALSAGGRGGGPNRSLGLPAAVTAVALVGLLVTLVRLLLVHPAARAVARRH